MSFEINQAKTAEWITEWRDSFGPIAQDPTSVKTLIYLTLLERSGEMTSYQDITDELTRREMIEGEVTKDDLVAFRNGMSQIVNALKTHDLYDIETRKTGRSSIYRLKSRDRAGARSNGATGPKTGEIVKILEDPELTATTKYEYVAEKLVINRMMPFYGIYLPITSASEWVLYVQGEARKRREYEGEECERLLGEWFSKYRGQEISVVGLGIGQGIGEIEIIERLLDKKREADGEGYGFGRIHYCAIDTNAYFLQDHIQRLEQKFKAEIEEGRLVCGVACGDFLKDFSEIIQRLRAEFAKAGYSAEPGEGFLPDTGTLISILGNVVGNSEKAKEWSYFEPVMKGMKGYDLAFLFGVSIHQPEQSKPENYDELEDLLLATPKFLTQSILQSGAPDDARQPEFTLPKSEKKSERWPQVIGRDYKGAGTEVFEGAQVTGKVYEFYYITEWDLSMDWGGKKLTIPKGSPLLLQNILKFNKETLIKFLESKGLYPSRQKPNPGDITSGNESRRYVMIAMTSRPPEQTA
ncbi:MAG: L-histidine N(alpha)-methyltransferase [Acidobacteria bacterium]|nr:L-histidine N(alpha)-methyltransferase [Acidobacteriota bacterium]